MPEAPRTAPNAFLERMEQQRLRQACTRVLDLRSRFPGKCKEYRHGSQMHFLDDVGIALFEKSLKEFGGQYTLGVYERVSAAEANLRNTDTAASAKPEAEADTLDGVRVIEFGYKPQRGESRLNYVSGIVAEPEDGSRIAGKTLDISLLGVRISLPLSCNLDKDARLYVHFEEMQQRSKNPFGPVAYIVVGVDLEAERRVLRLKRQMRAVERDFDRFVPAFIQSQTARYKLELKDALPTTYARVYERIYTQRTPALHAYFSCRDGKLDYAFSAGNADYAWGDQARLATLAARQLAQLTRVEELTDNTRRSEPGGQWLYAASLPGAPRRAFVVPAAALATAERRQQWFAVMRAADEARAFALLWHTTTEADASLSDAALELLPDSLDAARRLWKARLAQVTHACSLLPVLSALTPENRAALPTLPEWLLGFEVPPQTPPAVLGMGVRGGRVQERYLYSTRVLVDSGEGAVPGETLDFSINGLKVQLDIPVHLNAREDVLINLTDLREKVKDPSEVMQQPYRIVRVLRNGYVLCLERDHRQIIHKGARFFANIIQHNQHRLATCTAEQLATTEAKLGEGFVARNLSGLPLFLARDKDKKPFLLATAGNRENGAVANFRTRVPGGLALMNQREVLQNVLADACNNVGVIDKEKSGFLAWVYTGKDWRCAVIDARMPVTQRTALLRSALQRDGTQISAFTLMPAPVIDRYELDQDLQPILHNSRYRADTFRAELAQLIGVCELFDVTLGLRTELGVLDA